MHLAVAALGGASEQLELEQLSQRTRFSAGCRPSRISQQSGSPLLRGSVARFWLETYATDPERYGAPPLSRQRLHETRL